LALYGSEWSASLSSHFAPRERVPGTLLIRGWMGPRVGLQMVAKKKKESASAGDQDVVIQLISQSLY